MSSKLQRVVNSGAMLTLAVAGAPLFAMTSACRATPSEDPPILIERNMFDQERYNAESASTFFEDHRTMRVPAAGTIPALPPRTQANLHTIAVVEDDEVQTGLTHDAAGYVTGYSLNIPKNAIDPEGMKQMLDRGQERYGIYCVPCHGVTGDGKGMVARAGGFPPIPSYHDARIRQMPDGQLFNTISNGVRTMPSYAAQVPVMDRWAIVAYVRALQFSQLAEAEPKK